MTYRFRQSILSCIMVCILMICTCSCSPNKNTAASRRYQAFITKYNIYYNGDKHFRETLDDMEKKYDDDYSRQLYIHPIEAKGVQSVPQPSGDFNRSIEKAQKAIQLRSIKKKPAKKSGKANDAAYKEWMKRDEYNPFMHNAWMMMARGQYYNGDFLGAASTFFYITKHFTWLPATVTEAKLMQALCYISLGWQFEGEMILNRIKTDELTDKNLRQLYSYVRADYYLHAKDYAAAEPFLASAAKDADGAQHTRLYFLLGQVQQRLNKPKEAFKAFAKAAGAASATYRTKFNARIKQSEVYTGPNIESEVKSLRKMTRLDRNKEYLDQIYYAIGNLYLSHGDTLNAIANYELANEKSTRNGIEKAMNQLRLGELYFLQHNYEKAQPNYSGAVPQLPTTHPGYDAIKRRSDVLDELAVYSQNVNLQDSLLRLAAMDSTARLAVIDNIIKALRDKEEKEAKDAAREEFMANKAAQGSQMKDDTKSFTINSDNSWYFYNTATRNAGKTEFQKRWGARKLEDNWRRRNKASFNTSDFETASEAEGTDAALAENNDSTTVNGAPEEDPEKAKLKEDPHNREYYLAQIPFSDDEKTNSHTIIQEGLFNMGIILKDKLEDREAALSQFNRLLNDYPDNTYRLDTYYNLYLMLMRAGLTAEAERYRALILSDFPESKEGIAMTDPDFIEKRRAMDSREEALYQATYDAYLDNRNSEVHKAFATIAAENPMSKIMPKFMFLDALASVAEKNPEQFQATLKQLLERYPDTDITPTASAWLKGMAQGRELRASDTPGNLRGMIWDLRLSNDSTATAATEAAAFELDDNAPQTLVFLFPTDSISAAGLLYEIARHNFRSFVVRDFDLEPMTFGRLGMLVVRGFENMDELLHYRSVMDASDDLRLPAGVRPVVISAANLKMMLEQGRSFDEYFRYLEEQNLQQAHTKAFQPTQKQTTIQ